MGKRGMNNIEKYQKMAVMGFDGSNFYQATYQNKSYLAILDDSVLVLSEEIINEKSEFEDEMYVTEFSIQELEALEYCKMYAVYKGNEYMVQMVLPKLKELELIIRTGFEEEDYKLGFEENFHERITSKCVKFDEIKGIRVEKERISKE